MEDVEIADASKALYEAPFAMLAHEFSEAGAEQTEPSFVYANQVLTSLLVMSPVRSAESLVPKATIARHLGTRSDGTITAAS